MRKGLKTSIETRLKMSLASKGKKKNYQVWNKNKTGIYSEATLKKIREGRAKQVITEETKKKLSEASKKVKRTPEWLENNRQAQFRRFYILIPNYIPGARKSRRKQKLIENGGHHSKQEWNVLKAQYNFTCPACHKKEPGIKLTEDHIISVENGGSNNIENIQPLCRPCNSRKHSKTIRYLGRV